MRKSLMYVNLFLLTGLLLTGICCAKESTVPVNVFVSILPQKYFVERVGGDLVNVAVLVGPGQSPATYEPRPRQMAELSKAKIFFRIGVPFEQSLMPKIESAFKGLTVVDTRKGISLRNMAEKHDHAHEGEDRPDGKGLRGEEHAENHKEEHHHEAGAPDPHIWLDPVLVKTQAKTVCDALSNVDPQHAGTYRKNLEKFQSDLDMANDKIAKVLAPLKGKIVFVFHPAYGYFTDRYGLKQVAVETGGKEPTAGQLAELIDKAKRSGVKVIFVQPQFDRRNAETIAKAISGVVVSLDPLSPDYLKNLNDMASRMESSQALKK
ncbi:MAG: zinc ABC transporter substrate-binding protein [Pseudomonadota bacterium]